MRSLFAGTCSLDQGTYFEAAAKGLAEEVRPVEESAESELKVREPG